MRSRKAEQSDIAEPLNISDEAWFFHRIATSGHYHDGLHELMWSWTLEDLEDAHIVLDAYQESARKAEDKIRAERDQKSRNKVMSLRK